MKVNATIGLEVSTRDMAEAMSQSPDAFATFWFEFARIVRDKQIKLEPFGEAMSPDLGGIRKHPFTAIMDFMRYHERKNAGEAGNP